MAQDTFLHLTDFHFWEIVFNPFRLLNKRMLGNANVIYKRRKEFVLERANEYLEYAVSLGAPTAILSGDFCSTATEKEMAAGAKLAKALEDRGLDVIAIPGNHDVYTIESVRKRRFERHFDAWYPDEGLPARRVLPGGLDLVFVPTVCPDFQSRGRITAVEVEGVKEHLRNTGPHVVVVGHYPLLYETYGYQSNPPRRLRGAELLRTALGVCGKTILYISGHVHRFSYVTDPQHANLRHLTTGAFLRTAPESNSVGEFSQITSNNGEFEIIRHIKRDKWIPEVVEPRLI